MREQLIQYVTLLFAGAKDCEDMKQEILQNTLDRYDDLIAEGKVPEAAYRMAITGIGDINEILGSVPTTSSVYTHAVEPKTAEDEARQKQLRATAIALYILCPIPLFLTSELGNEILGLCILLSIVALATALIIMSSKKETEEAQKVSVSLTPQQQMRKSIKSILNAIGLVSYFLISLFTRMWHITWLVFPIMAALWQLINAILDLKEAKNHEI